MALHEPWHRWTREDWQQHEAVVARIAEYARTVEGRTAIEALTRRRAEDAAVARARSRGGDLLAEMNIFRAGVDPDGPEAEAMRESAREWRRETQAWLRSSCRANIYRY